jgi:hypothetical protein
MGSTINLQDEIIQRCWNALPEVCPLREMGYEKFTMLWVPWIPYELATIDPLCKIDHSIVLLEFILGSPNQNQSESLQEHFEWMLKHADEEYVKKWNKDLMRCKKYAAQPDMQLVAMLGMDEALTADNEDRGSPTKSDIRKHLSRSGKAEWPDIEDHQGWNHLWKKAGKHAMFFQSQGGRPSKKLLEKNFRKSI